MMTTLSAPVEVAVYVTLVAITGALFLALHRLARGPSTPDRVVALDLAAVLAIGIVVVYTILANEPELMQAATVAALLTFLGTVAIARYLEKRAR